MEDYPNSNNTRQVWHWVQDITSYKPSDLSVAEGDSALASLFFARFEVESPEVATFHP